MSHGDFLTNEWKTSLLLPERSSVSANIMNECILMFKLHFIWICNGT